MNAIHVTDLVKIFRRGQVKALSGCSLTVEDGQIFGLLGPNGAGKTTLLKIILDLVRATSGTVRVLGQPSTDIALHARIGYLPEEHHFPPFLSAKAILSHYGTIAGVPSSRLKDRIPGLLEQVKLSNRADTRVKEFSKGMIQRLALAHALINDPELLLLDEPTDGIDPIGRREIRDILQNLNKQGKTIFLNSHILSEVERVCDHVAIMNHGQVVFHGDTESALRNEHQVQLSVTPEHVLINACHDLDIVLETNNHHIRVTVDNTGELNRLLDRIRSDNGLIHAVVPWKQSLEDRFLTVISDSPGGEL
jgi:ABC-2 type transport system ATP-binding protein